MCAAPWWTWSANIFGLVLAAFCARCKHSTGGVPVHCPGVSSTNESSKDLGPYPSGATISMVGYANFHQDCIDAALTPFMQYLPFLMLLQAGSCNENSRRVFIIFGKDLRISKLNL